MGRRMKIFVIGDYRTGTGPANVTLEYLKRLPRGTRHLVAKSKALRAVEILLKMPSCDVVLFSGYSKQNILGLKLAHKLKKPTAYLMHGCVEHENAINECIDKEMNRVERMTMELSDRIYAVSSQFAKWLRTNYPEYSDKIEAMPNGVNTELLKDVLDIDKIQARDSLQIFTIGGGMPRKKIKHICEAIAKINRRYGEMTYRLVVVGDKGKDDDIINAYPFVENLGLVDFEKTKQLYRESALFVQNSCFETFGLAPMEALMCGCNVLLSREIGALELFNNVEDGDIINNFYDEAEIASKIDRLLKVGNASRLIRAFDRESASWEKRTVQLQKKLVQLVMDYRKRK